MKRETTHFSVTDEVVKSVGSVKTWGSGGGVATPFLLHYPLVSVGSEFHKIEPAYSPALYVAWVQDDGEAVFRVDWRADAVEGQAGQVTHEIAEVAEWGALVGASAGALALGRRRGFHRGDDGEAFRLGRGPVVVVVEDRLQTPAHVHST